MVYISEKKMKFLVPLSLLILLEKQCIGSIPISNKNKIHLLTHIFYTQNQDRSSK